MSHLDPTRSGWTGVPGPWPWAIIVNIALQNLELRIDSIEGDLFCLNSFEIFSIKAQGPLNFQKHFNQNSHRIQREKNEVHLSFGLSFGLFCHHYQILPPEPLWGCKKIITWPLHRRLRRIYVLANNLPIHSSEIGGGLCLMKWSNKILQNLPYCYHKKTHIVFFVFHFVQLYFFPS